MTSCYSAGGRPFVEQALSGFELAGAALSDLSGCDALLNFLPPTSSPASHRQAERSNADGILLRNPQRR